MFVARKQCPPIIMVDWLLKNSKLKRKTFFAIAIAKDTDYNILETILGDVFDLNMTDPYAIACFGDSNGYEFDGAMAEMKSILESANDKYNRWKDLKLVPEIAALQPNSRTFRSKWEAVWAACSYQYGENDFVDSLMVGFLWSIVHGILYLIFTAVAMVIAYPVIFIYDACCSGIYNKLGEVLREKYISGLYVPTTSIDSEIMNSMTSLAKKLSTSSRPVNVSRSQDANYIVAETRSEEDAMVTHYADIFFLNFEIENLGDQALVASSLDMDAV